MKDVSSLRTADGSEHVVPVWRTGFPDVNDYADALASEELRELAEYSGRFRENRPASLSRYSSKWVSDPLHHWSRQWEYPFTLSRLRELAAGRRKITVLDAGSGFTFFPYYLSQTLEAAFVWCADSDSSLAPLHRASRAAQKVAFVVSSLLDLPFPDEYFDVVYSISVLEHMTNHAQAINELARVTRPGGSLLLTFDVSPDGSRRLNPDQAKGLLDLAATKFEIVDAPPGRLSDQLSDPAVFTTEVARRIDARLLPWKFPRILYQVVNLVRSGRLAKWPPRLAVYCMEATRR